MSKKVKLRVGAIIASVILLVACEYIIFLCKISVKNIEIVNYTSIDMSDEIIENINSGKIIENSSYFSDMWVINNDISKEYGNLFRVVYRFNLRRYVKLNDCIIEKAIDYSKLDDSENIFFALSTGEKTPTYVFGSNGDGLSAVTYVTLWGCTYGKTDIELEEIVKKVKITLLVQHSNGIVDTKTIGINDIDVDFNNANENDIYSAEKLLRLN